MNDRFSSSGNQILLLFMFFLPFTAIAQQGLEPLPPLDSLSDWQINSLVKQYRSQVIEIEQEFKNKLLLAEEDLEIKSEMLSLAKQDSTLGKAELDSISTLVKSAKKERKSAVKNEKKAASALKLADKTVDSDNNAQRKNLPKLWKETNKLWTMVHPPEPKEEAYAETEEQLAEVAADDTGAGTPKEPESKPKTADPKSTVTLKKYNPEEDVMLHPPALPCVLAVNTRDEFSGEIYKRTAAVELFRTYPSALRSFLGDKPNVLCKAAMAATGSEASLFLNFSIYDPNPRKSFGRLEKNSAVTILFLDGSRYVLNTTQDSEGTLNEETQAFVYQVQLPLSQDALKKLRREELDRIRITWSSGYEDYDVQYIQLLSQQATCLFD
ncbi:MAG: hypothetical protein H6576_16935 [Lewinellaceae bacterium]|nr:hypothetical protein [Lewinellaceae bacterium]